MVKRGRPLPGADRAGWWGESKGGEWGGERGVSGASVPLRRSRAPAVAGTLRSAAADTPDISVSIVRRQLRRKALRQPPQLKRFSRCQIGHRLRSEAAPPKCNEFHLSRRERLPGACALVTAAVTIADPQRH